MVGPHEFDEEFNRLINEYEEYYWLVAWAGSNFSILRALKKNARKIKKIVVGIHFYQTHPEFIRTFMDNKHVRFIKQPVGTFHPKLYFFRTGDTKWEMVIGSANFTEYAFNYNLEVLLLISSAESVGRRMHDQVFKLIRKVWKDATYFNNEELDDYERVWARSKQKLQSIAGLPRPRSHDTSGHPLHQVQIVNMSS